jgi:hypothetical protein
MNASIAIRHVNLPDRICHSCSASLLIGSSLSNWLCQAASALLPIFESSRWSKGANSSSCFAFVVLARMPGGITGTLRSSSNGLDGSSNIKAKWPNEKATANLWRKPRQRNGKRQRRLRRLVRRHHVNSLACFANPRLASATPESPSASAKWRNRRKRNTSAGRKRIPASTIRHSRYLVQ